MPHLFYTRQCILHYAAAEGDWNWVGTYPNDVIGVAMGNHEPMYIPRALCNDQHEIRRRMITISTAIHMQRLISVLCWRIDVGIRLLIS